MFVTGGIELLPMHKDGIIRFETCCCSIYYRGARIY